MIVMELVTKDEYYAAPVERRACRVDGWFLLTDAGLAVYRSDPAWVLSDIGWLAKCPGNVPFCCG